MKLRISASPRSCAAPARGGARARRAYGLLGDERGAAAVEFGLLAPLLILMLMGTVEVARAVSADRHFTSAVQTAGDLVAREPYLGLSSSAAYSNLDKMMLSIQHLMAPYDASAAKLKLAIFSVRTYPDKPNQGQVVWNYSHGLTAPAKCSSYTLPAGLVGSDASVIVVQAEYKFKPLFGDFVPGFGAEVTWTDKSYHSPRNLCVDYVEGDNCNSKC